MSKSKQPALRHTRENEISRKEPKNLKKENQHQKKRISSDSSPHFYKFFSAIMASRYAIGSSQVFELLEREAFQIDQDQESEAHLDAFVGVISASIVGIRYYNGRVENRQMVSLVREPLNPYDGNAIRVNNMLGHHVGHIKRQQAAMLAPLLDGGEIRVEAEVKRAGANNAYTIPILVTVFGAEGQEDYLFNVLSEAFDVSDIPTERFKQPKKMKVQVRKTLDELYNAVLKPRQDGPEMEPCPAVKTKLFPHQKQALHWMAQCERRNFMAPFYLEDAAKAEYKSILTNTVFVGLENKPLCKPAGILADDMGLGKTLSIISLIFTNGLDDVPLSEPSPGFVREITSKTARKFIADTEIADTSKESDEESDYDSDDEDEEDDEPEATTSSSAKGNGGDEPWLPPSGESNRKRPKLMTPIQAPVTESPPPAQRAARQTRRQPSRGVTENQVLAPGTSSQFLTVKSPAALQMPPLVRPAIPLSQSLSPPVFVRMPGTTATLVRPTTVVSSNNNVVIAKPLPVNVPPLSQLTPVPVSELPMRFSMRPPAVSLPSSLGYNVLGPSPMQIQLPTQPLPLEQPFLKAEPSYQDSSYTDTEMREHPPRTDSVDSIDTGAIRLPEPPTPAAMQPNNIGPNNLQPGQYIVLHDEVNRVIASSQDVFVVPNHQGTPFTTPPPPPPLPPSVFLSSHGQVSSEPPLSPSLMLNDTSKPMGCICRSDNRRGFLVQCRHCQQVSHGRCENINRRVLATMDMFVCARCKVDSGQQICLNLDGNSELPHATSTKRMKTGGRQQQGRPKTTLIICPMSLLSHWTLQLEEHIHKNVPFKLAVHYGSDKITKTKDAKECDIVLSTYGTVANEFNKKKNGIIFQAEWMRVILDEGHLIKNEKTQTYKAIMALKCERKWVITGTPIQNNVAELHTLVSWLGIEPLTNRGLWKGQIEKPVKLDQEIGMKRLQILMASISLRRCKSDEVNGKPLVDLPKKTFLVRSVTFSREEQDTYMKLQDEGRSFMSRLFDSGQLMTNYASVFALICRLRQYCCHPEMLPANVRASLLAAVETATAEVAAADSLDEDQKEELLNFLRDILQQGVDQDCSICLDPMMSKKLVMTVCRHIYCKDCIHRLMEESNNRNASCPLCRGNISKDTIVESQDESVTEAGEEAIETERSSSKLNAVLADLKELRANRPKDKIVIVSQFTSYLSILQPLLDQAGNGLEKYVRLDGSVSSSQRSAVINEFQRGRARVLLLSLKAGGIGLNLVAANHLFLLDPAWNPATESQCFDRIFRLGQTKPVFIYKYIVRGTIEERIVEMQERKKALAAGAFGGAAGQAQTAEQRIQDLRALIDF